MSDAKSKAQQEFILNHLTPEVVLDYYGVEVENRRSARDGGDNLDCVCPYHDTTSVTLTMSSLSGLWFCRSALCGKSGTLIRFVALQEDCPDAVAFRKLCSIADVPIPSFDSVSLLESELYSVGRLEEVKPAEVPEAMAWPDGYEICAHPYFVKNRGIPAEVLISAKAGRIKDSPFYAHRACVPILQGGHLYSVYSRRTHSANAWIKKHPGEEDKVEKFYPRHHYASSTLTSHLLFGLDEVTGPEVLMVESISSVLMLRSWGIGNAVAMLKAKLSRPQVALLVSRGFTRYLIASDNDLKVNADTGKQFNPGRKAAWASYRLLKSYGEVGILDLPTNEDPADMEEEDFMELYKTIIYPQTIARDKQAIARFLEGAS